MSGTAEEEEWQVATRRKGAARRSKTLQVSSGLNPGQDHLDIKKTIRRIHETASELRCEEFWQDWKEQLLAASSSLFKPCEDQLEEGSGPCHQLQCVCYGLGSFSSCVSARYQLAMLLLLLETGQIALKDCSVYDPAFSTAEEDVLRELGLTLLTENEEGKRLATKPTLFYLMHCGKALYNNLLWKNWSAHCLFGMMIIGNSFSGMRERTIEREFQRDYKYISRAADFCEERRLSCPSRLIDVFSDTSVISFPFCILSGLPQSTWTESSEPQYQHCPDLEIIQRETRS